MKRLVTLLLTFMFTVCSVVGTMVTVSASSSIVSGDYKFVDIAYSPSLGMYVAAAKGEYTNTDKTYKTKLYTSKDKINWTESYTLPAATSNFAKSLKQSVEWWDTQKMFVVYASAKLYFSSDGLTWTENSAAQRADGGIVVKDEQLVVSGGRAVRIATTPSVYTQVIFAATAANFYPTAIGVSKLRADSTKKYIMASNGYVYSFLATYSDNTYTYPNVEQTNANAQLANTGGILPTDFVYNAKRDEWILVYGGTNLKIFRGSENTNYGAAVMIDDVSNESGITAAYINDDYIIIGLANGKVYHTPNTSSEITSGAVWTEMKSKQGSTPMSEEVTSIKEGVDGEFIISTDTKLYIATISEYMDSSEYVSLGVPEVVGANPFINVKLIGGVYSPTLKKYVVYGNSTIVGETNKAIVFTSTDGLKWTRKHIGTAAFLETANGSVWWDAQSTFILSASTKDTTGASYVSEDGETWRYVGDKLFGLYSEIAVAGDYLYSTSGGKVLYKFTDLTLVGRESIDLSSIATVANTYHTKIATSNQSDPAVLTVASYLGLVRNNDATGTELEKWTYKTNVTNSGTSNDMKYINSIGKFLIASQNRPMTIIDKIGTVTSGPANPSGMNVHYFDTNGSKFVFGANNNANPNIATVGAIYKAEDNTSFGSTTQMTVLPLLQNGCMENTMPVTNIFTDISGKFFVTVSNNTDSDLLIVDAAANGYVKASDNIAVDTIKPGDQMTVRIKYINKPDTAADYSIISAIYDGQKLIQAFAEPVTMLGSANGYLVQTFTVDSDISNEATMKVFLWNSLGGMIPISGATDFFR